MQVSHKVWIGSIMGGNMIFNGDKFVSVEVAHNNIAKVNLVANVVDVYANDEKKFNSITLDDGSGQIRVKGFSDNSFLLDGIIVGETMCIVGWLRYFNNEVYVIPEIVRRVDGKWALIRRLELIKMYGEPKADKEEKIENPAPGETIASNIVEVKSEKIETDNTKQAIFALIKKNNDGIDIEQLIMETNFPVEKINSVLNSLIEAGDIYEPMPGRLRAM